MAIQTLDSETVRAKNDAQMRRLDDFVPVAAEAIRRMQREDYWNDAAAHLDAMIAAQDRCDRDIKQSPDDPVTDAIWTAVVDAKLVAENKLIETPAPNGAALVRKLELLVADGGNVPTERLALLLEDARRIFA